MSLFIAAFALFTGCSTEPQVCTDMLAFSATIDVVDENGDPIVATVTATDEAGNDVVVRCADGTDTGDTCTQWIVGDEVAGKITIHGEASRECNTGTGELVVDVPMDDEGCHVVGQTGTLEITEWTDLGCGA